MAICAKWIERPLPTRNTGQSQARGGQRLAPELGSPVTAAQGQPAGSATRFGFLQGSMWREPREAAEFTLPDQLIWRQSRAFSYRQDCCCRSQFAAGVFSTASPQRPFRCSAPPLERAGLLHRLHSFPSQVSTFLFWSYRLCSCTRFLSQPASFWPQQTQTRRKATPSSTASYVPAAYLRNCTSVCV